MDGYDALLLVFFAQALDGTVYEKSPRMWRNFDPALQVSATGPWAARFAQAVGTL